MLVIETSDEGIEKARQNGAEVITGNAADPAVLAAANVAGARRLFVTIPEPFEAGQAVQQARAANPALDILARAHSDAAVDHLSKLGANLVVMGESEIADRMLERAQGKNGAS
jgi:CPA2 family monovalent cation:H+ antiporter-2